MEKIDSIIIGYNEVNFNSFCKKQKQFSEVSGTYSELKTNSIPIDNNRYTYTELLNKVLFNVTNKEWNLNSFNMPNLGVAYLANFLIEKEFKVVPINFFNSSKEKLTQLLQKDPLSVVITTTYYVEDEPIKEIVKFVRKINSKVKIIVGGPRILNICATQSEKIQKLIFKSIGANIYINDSQGESTLLKVLLYLSGGLDLGNIPNLIYEYSASEFLITNRIPEKNDLDKNAIKWSNFDKDFFTPMTYMRTARSCPFSCSFCNYPSMAGRHSLMSIEVIENEMQYLNDSGVKYLIFIDDTFNVPLPRFKEICRMMIKNNFQFQWISFFRCSNSDDEAFDLMKESGCIGVFLGIESGNQRILNNMNKFANLEKYKYGIKQLVDRGIMTLASIIVGFPGETEESINDTLNFLDESETTFYNVQLYYHDSLAPIERKREEYEIEGSGYNWKHKTMDWKQATRWKEYLIKNTTNPILMPLYGFSIWTIPYLLQYGISLEQIKCFAKTANTMLIKSLEKNNNDFSNELENLSLLFKNIKMNQKPLDRS